MSPRTCAVRHPGHRLQRSNDHERRGYRTSEQLVSVVVPAYNAAATIGKTLLSARRQTHARIEIIVVNDGSTDATLEIAQAHARADSRIRVLDTPNAGVATARNRGIAEARADLIASLDADDIWSPSKIELQLAEMERGGPRIGFVYTGFRRIDIDDRVLQTAALQCVNGRGFFRAIFSNFVANGSSLLLRRAAFDEAGGYEPHLRRMGVEGAEDQLLQIAIARRWSIACIPFCLVGYRQTPGAMSRDPVRMARAQLAVIDLVEARYPDVPAWLLRATRADLQARLAIAYAARRRLGPFLRATARSLWSHPVCGMDTLYALARLRFRKAGLQAAASFRGARASASEPLFRELDPRAGLKYRAARPNGWMIRRLEEADGGFTSETLQADVRIPGASGCNSSE